MTGTSDVRVVVQNGEYWLCNKGDLAMLDVTIRRLVERWPGARVGVMTSAPHLLRAFAPGTEPILDRGPGTWPGRGRLAPLAERAGPRVVGPPSVGWLTARGLPRRYGQRLRQAVTRPYRRSGIDRRVGSPEPSGSPRVEQQRVPAALRTASLVLANGGGYLTDVDPIQAHRTLTLLEYAADHGIPTAMVGQGIGPIDDPHLLERAAAVLPRVDVIGVREGLAAPGLLTSLGVPADRVAVTGDDAVELSYSVRREPLGSGLGVCLRVADYSPVAAVARDRVGTAVREAAREFGAGLVPLIISEYRSEDRRSTLPLTEGFGEVVPPLGRYVTPRRLAARVSACRVVVTGAYHLAVFALAQGIPVVGLSSSRYYDHKLLGLDAMFGGGLQPVRLDEPDLLVKLGGAIRLAWTRADELREPLRERARHQIRLSRQCFERVFQLVDGSRPEGSRTTLDAPTTREDRRLG